MNSLWAVKDYETSGRLRRFLRLNRLVEFEIDAAPGQCLERIQSLRKRKSPIPRANNEILLDTVKRPYRFVYIVRDDDRYRGERVFMMGRCTGKGDQTLVEIEAFTGNNGFELMFTGVFFAVLLILFSSQSFDSVFTIVVFNFMFVILGIYTLHTDQDTQDKAIDLIQSQLISPQLQTRFVPYADEFDQPLDPPIQETRQDILNSIDKALNSVRDTSHQ